MIAKGGDPSVAVGGELGACEVGGSTEACRERHVLRAGPQAAFLTAAVDDWLQRHAGTDIEGGHTLGRVHLVVHNDINFVASRLPDDPEPERHKAWARAAWEAMRPFAHGVYVNFMSDEPGSHVLVTYGDRRYTRLAALKSKYDPSFVFRFNQNIPPAS